MKARRTLSKTLSADSPEALDTAYAAWASAADEAEIVSTQLVVSGTTLFLLLVYVGGDA